ncbi:MAG: PAS domain S-box protein, partial [Rhodanobacteraceae bacterium]
MRPANLDVKNRQVDTAPCDAVSVNVPGGTKLCPFAPDAGGAPPRVRDYADLFEHAPVGYVVLDGAGRIGTINRIGAAILGWEPSWLAGRLLSSWVTNEDKPMFQAHWIESRNGKDGASQEVRIKNRQGRVVD